VADDGAVTATPEAPTHETLTHETPAHETLTHETPAHDMLTLEHDETLVRPGPRDVGRLLVSCPDQSGIVAAVTSFLAGQGANIVESQQYSTDPSGGRFFLRLEFVLAELSVRLPQLELEFTDVGQRFGMHTQWTQAANVKRLVIFVSRADHALQELLWRTHSGDLPADIAMIVSNHADLEPVARSFGVAYHHVPVSAHNRSEAEERQLELVADADLVVLARYMQVLSPGFLQRYPGRVINIHHSFLPAFVGADPYRAAHQRGVKLIGATAHYVTDELDAGPIIEQDVQRVDHRQSVEELRRLGRHVERTVLARAVSWHLEDRVLVHGNSTIVFS
jgi:formyltetrahydrofolate deformylase